MRIMASGESKRNLARAFASCVLPVEDERGNEGIKVSRCVKGEEGEGM